MAVNEFIVLAVVAGKSPTLIHIFAGFAFYVAIRSNIDRDSLIRRLPLLQAPSAPPAQSFSYRIRLRCNWAAEVER